MNADCTQTLVKRYQSVIHTFAVRSLRVFQRKCICGNPTLGIKEVSPMANRKVTVRLIIDAILSELRKLNKPVNEAEFRILVVVGAKL